MKIILTLLLSLFSVSVFADWKIQGEIFYHAALLKLDQRLKPNKKYEIKKDGYVFTFDAEQAEENNEIIFKCYIHELVGNEKGKERAYLYQRAAFSTKVVKDDDKNFSYTFIINHILK